MSAQEATDEELVALGKSSIARGNGRIMGADPEPMHAREWVAIALIGVVGGLLSSLFAIGGGIVMVPLLIAFAKLDQRTAAATSLAAVIPTSIAGSITYSAAGKIDLTAAIFVSVGAVVGAILGSALLKRTPLTWLRWMFIVFILLVAVRLFLVTPVRSEKVELTLLVGLGYVVLGLVMGVLSSLFGIGGGIIAVPALIGAFGVSDLIAKGTSLVVMIPTSVVGTESNRRARTVDVPVGLLLGAAATAASVPGAALALALPARLSSVLFAVLLLAVAAQLAHRALEARTAHPTQGHRRSAAAP